MPASTTLIFDDTLAPAAINATDPFRDGSFFWFDAPTITQEAAVECYLQIEVGPAAWRNVPLDRSAIVTTAETLTYPKEYRNSEYDCRLVIISDEALPFRIYLAATDECAELKELETKVNWLLATSVVNQLIDLAIPLLTGGVSTLLVDGVVGGALRAGTKILNPTNTPIHIGLGDIATAVDFDYLLPPGGFLETPFQGDIFAYNPGPDPLALEVKIASFTP